MANKICPFTWKHFLIRLILALLSAWVFMIVAMSLIYVENLLNPVCSKSDTTPQGFQSTNLTTADNLTLQGWWHPSGNGKVVLLLGGLGASRDSMLPDAQMLVENGYGALTLDYRHCAGEISTLGYREVQELQAMVRFVQAQPDVEYIAVLGFSVGGAVALLGSAQIPEIDAVIAEGNYANLKDEITAMVAAPLTLQWQIQQMVLFGYRLRTGISPARVSPIDAIPFISPRPILFIHGENETARSRAESQFQAAGATGRLWIVPNTGHGGYRQNHPDEYSKQVLQFLQQSLQD